MANYQQTTTAINSQIKSNGNREISGQILQNVLNTIVNNLKQGYLLVGIATPDGNPGTPDQDVCWLATKGTYVNYGNITVGNGKLAVIKYNGTWTYDTVDVQGAVKSGDGITIDPESGKVSVNVGDGLQISGSKVTAKVGDGMQIAGGRIAANVGDGLQIAGGKSAVNAGNGIKIEDGKVAIDLIAGSYINIENGNKINCTLDANPFYVVDELPEVPPEGLKNKLWLVPVSGQPAVDLYKWNEETSQFDKVGTIALDVNTALFIKKGTNDITEPLELNSSVESTTPEKEQEVLTIKSSNSPSVFFRTLTEDTEEGGVDYMVVKARISKDSRVNRRSIGLGIIKKDGSYVMAELTKEGILNLRGIAAELIYRPTYYIRPPAGESWNKPNTFSLPGIYSKLKTVLALNADVVLTFASRDVNIETDMQYYPTDGDFEFTYRFSGLRFLLRIKSDDSMTIISGAYIWRFNATDYGFRNWSSASGTNVNLYNDLKKLINGTDNVGGILGYLCDHSNVFVITNLHFSEETLEVGFKDAHANVDRRMSINPSGQYNVIDMSTVRNIFSAIDIGVDTFYPTSNKSYSGLTDFATQFIRLAQSGMPVFLKTKNNQISTSEDVLVPIMNVIFSSGSVTAYYLKVETTRIGRFSIYVTSKGSVTINTLGS